MATKTITQLDAATALDHDDVFAVDEDGATKKITNARLHNEAPLATLTSGSDATTISLTSGNVHDVTLISGVTYTFSGSAASTACSFTLIQRQDGTGSRSVTWPAAVDWAGGTGPTITTASNSVDVFTFVTVNNGTTWLGFVAGKDVK